MDLFRRRKIIGMIALIMMSFSIVSQLNYNIYHSTGFMFSNNEKKLNFDLNFIFGNQSSLNITFESWITLYHEPDTNITTGDQVIIYAGLTEGESSIILNLQNLGDFSALEGEYSFLIENALGTISIPIPGASADFPILGNVTAYLEAQFKIRIDLDDSGPGEFIGVDSKELTESSLEDFDYKILPSTPGNDTIVIEASYTFIFKEIKLKLKVGGTTVFSWDIQNVDEEKTLVNILQDEIIVIYNNNTTAHEVFSIIMGLIILVSLKTRFKNVAKSKEDI